MCRNSNTSRVARLSFFFFFPFFFLFGNFASRDSEARERMKLGCFCADGGIPEVDNSVGDPRFGERWMGVPCFFSQQQCAARSFTRAEYLEYARRDRPAYYDVVCRRWNRKRSCRREVFFFFFFFFFLCFFFSRFFFSSIPGRETKWLTRATGFEVWQPNTSRIVYTMWREAFGSSYFMRKFDCARSSVASILFTTCLPLSDIRLSVLKQRFFQWKRRR